MKDGDAGAALVTAILLSLGGVLLAHGALVLAQAELLAARSAVRTLRLELLAERAALALLDPPRDTLPPGTAVADSVAGRSGAAAWSGRLHRLSSEIWLAEGVAVERSARRSVGLPVWRLDALTRVAAIGAALSTAGTATTDGLSRVRVAEVGGSAASSPPAGCERATPTQPPLPTWRSDPDSSVVTLGALTLGALTARADFQLTGTGTPTPLESSGSCPESPWNWGDPGGSGGPCRDRLQVLDAAPGVVIEGGIGQGLLLARGDITLRGTAFYGVLLAEGLVVLEGATVVRGMIVARGGAVLLDEARLIGSTCWAEFAFGAPALRRATPIVPTRWIRLDG